MALEWWTQRCGLSEHPGHLNGIWTVFFRRMAQVTCFWLKLVDCGKQVTILFMDQPPVPTSAGFCPSEWGVFLDVWCTVSCEGAAQNPQHQKSRILEIVISSNNSQAWFPELGVPTFFLAKSTQSIYLTTFSFDLFHVNNIEHPSRNNKKPCWEAISVTFRVSPQCHYRITHANANACYSITWMIQDDTGFESTSNQKGATYNVSV